MTDVFRQHCQRSKERSRLQGLIQERRVPCMGEPWARKGEFEFPVLFVAAMLLPTNHPLGTKRICVDTGYCETFNRPNMELMDVRATPIEQVTPTDMRITTGDDVLDAIVLATGYDALTGALARIDIRGLGGPYVLLSMVVRIEQQVEWLAR